MRVKGIQHPRIKWQKIMRVKLAGQLGETYPEVMQLLLNYYNTNSENKGLLKMGFKCHDLPISLNHMYLRNRDFKGGQFKADGSQKKAYRLHPSIHEYRLLVMEALGQDRWKWKPTGVTAAIILLESPHWLTQRRQVKEEDADNKVKPIFDAVENATETPDELHWQFHVFKIFSKWRRTTVYLFDLGDVVEFYS